MKLFLRLFLGIGLAVASACASLEFAPAELNQTQEAAQPEASVFGRSLFMGRFAASARGFANDRYRIDVGDTIRLHIWGSMELSAELPVDSQGNIFIPRVGPVPVLGVENRDLGALIKQHVQRIYKDGMNLYADLVTMQPVQVFVTGNVVSPGLYQGLSSDSVIQFLDRARGIDPKTGTFRNVQVLRDNKIHRAIDLYGFLVQGQHDLFQFHNGDVIFVGNRGAQVNVNGSVRRPFGFEFLDQNITLDAVLRLAVPTDEATNLTVTRMTQDNRLTRHIYRLDEAKNVALQSGDSVEVFPDHSSPVITVSVKGEHESLQTHVLPKGSTLGDLLKLIKPTPYADMESLQLYRQSVALMQRQLIDAKLKELEAMVLTTSSGSAEEANIRAKESELILKFIDRARSLEPKGQVVLNEQASWREMLLEHEDVVVIPGKSDTVIVHGEVNLPSAHAFRSGSNAKAYIKLSGGYNDRADCDRVMVIRRSGKVEQFNDGWFSSAPRVYAGDSILVMPKLDIKTMQITKDMTQIIYQIAVATKVMLTI